MHHASRALHPELRIVLTLQVVKLNFASKREEEWRRKELQNVILCNIAYHVWARLFAHPNTFDFPTSACATRSMAYRVNPTVAIYGKIRTWQYVIAIEASKENMNLHKYLVPIVSNRIKCDVVRARGYCYGNVDRTRAWL